MIKLSAQKYHDLIELHIVCKLSPCRHSNTKTVSLFIVYRNSEEIIVVVRNKRRGEEEEERIRIVAAGSSFPRLCRRLQQITGEEEEERIRIVATGSSFPRLRRRQQRTMGERRRRSGAPKSMEPSTKLLRHP